MNSAWLLLLLPLAASSGWWLGFRQQKTKEKDALDFNQSCLKGINQILTLEDDEALDTFLAAMKQQPKSVELQMVLGSICRRQGEYERASLIHQTIINSDLHSKQVREQAQFELAQDYQAAGWLDRSEDLYTSLLESASFKHDSATQLLRIYQQVKDWQKAIEMNRFLNALDQDTEHNRQELAHFYCELCEDCIKEGQFSKAKSHLKSAVKINPVNPRVIILSGRMAVFSGDQVAAKRAWDKLCLNAPMFLGVAIKSIEDSYQLSNDKTAYLSFLKKAASNTQDPKILSALLRALKADGGQSASQFIMQYLKDRPSIEGVKQILLNWQQMPKPLSGQASSQLPGQIGHEDLLFLVETMAEMLKVEDQYQCMECGFKAQKFEWACPSCQRWGAYQSRVQTRPDKRVSFESSKVGKIPDTESVSGHI